MKTKILPELKIILMTSTDTGCDYVEYLEDLNFVRLSLIVTNPDKPRGRGRGGKKLPLRARVAEFCDQKKICVFQPESVNSPDAVVVLREISADIIMVVDFGQILSGEVLNIPRGGSFNMHYSLLPDLRGPEPVRWALLKGYDKTGVSLIKMNEEIDKGEIVFKKEVPIAEEDNYGSLKKKLTDEGVNLLKKFLEKVYNKKYINYIPQVQGSLSGFDYASKIDKKLCLIDWNLSADEIVARIRAMSPMPGCYANFQDRRIKIIVAGKNIISRGSQGSVNEITKKSFSVSASSGGVRVLKLQPEGKRVMDAVDFISGYHLKVGSSFK